MNADAHGQSNANLLVVSGAVGITPALENHSMGTLIIRPSGQTNRELMGRSKSTLHR